MLAQTMDSINLLVVEFDREHDIDDDKKMVSTPNIKEKNTTPTNVVQILQPMHLAFRGFIDNNVMNKGRIKYSF
jgi:hypothetical protein